MAVAWALFVLGLFPSYVSVLVVEKYYTSFWTGFWNLYGLIMTSVGLALDDYNPWLVWGLFAGVAVIFITVFAILFLLEVDIELPKRAEGWIVRHLGASWVATSLNWGLYIGFAFGTLWGFLAMIVHGFLMLLLILMFV